MELIKLTPQNLADEHICCAISNNNDIQVASKKAWLADRLKEGLVFLEGNVRGKCFIEYIPAEAAWAPLEAAGYTYIDCLWVSGQFKGHGYSSQLLDQCIADSRAQGKAGLVVLSSQKKAGFLADPGYLRHKGFVTVDTAPPYFELMYLPFEPQAARPSFKTVAKAAEHPEMGAGLVMYYTDQCPFTAKYVPLLKAVAEREKVPLKVIHLQSADQARSCPSPFTTFALYGKGRFITHEIQSEKKFEAIIADYR